MTAPIRTLEAFLRASGLLDNTWTNDDIGDEPAPELQLRLFDESIVDKNLRILLIKSVSAGSGNRYTSSPVFLFSVMGKVGESPVYAEIYAEIIYKELLNFEYDDEIGSIDPMGAVNGAYLTESGRPVYDMEFTVNVDSQRIGEGNWSV